MSFVRRHPRRRTCSTKDSKQKAAAARRNPTTTRFLFLHPPPYQATSAAAADGGGDVFRPPPPALAYKLYQAVPEASGSSTEASYYDDLLLASSPRSPFRFADAAASAPPTSASAELKDTASLPSASNFIWAPYFSLAKGGDGKGAPGAGCERWSSAASVDGKGSVFIPAPEAAVSRPGPSGYMARSGLALSSQAEAGQASFSTSPRSASSSAYVPHDGIALCTCKCNQCKKAELNSLSSEEEESIRGLIAAEADPSSIGNLRHVGSNYWDHFPFSEDLNPAGFSSRHPLWEGFALPAKLEGKMGFLCVFCDKKFVGSADKGVNHMLRNKGCLISDVHRQILFDKVDAYRKRKQDLLKRKRGRKI